MSKLFQSIQSFVYSCCSEASEIKRCARNQKSDSPTSAFFSKFGIEKLSADNMLIHLPQPSYEIAEQIFEGRIGKLRQFAFPLVAACSAVSKEIVPLVFNLEYDRSVTSPSSLPETVARAPIVFPMLLGHVLTHVVAALCAACGKTRVHKSSPAIKDEYDVSPGHLDEHHTPPPNDDNQLIANEETVIIDCDNFIKLGLLARILQTLLGTYLGWTLEQESTTFFPKEEEEEKLENLMNFLTNIRGELDELAAEEDEQNEDDQEDYNWYRNCHDLLTIAITPTVKKIRESNEAMDEELPFEDSEDDVYHKFSKACTMAHSSAISYLSNISLIYQIIFPGITNEISTRKVLPALSSAEFCLQNLMDWLLVEPIQTMISSQNVQDLLSHWFSEAFERRTCDNLCDCLFSIPFYSWPMTHLPQDDSADSDLSHASSDDFSGSHGNIDFLELSGCSRRSSRSRANMVDVLDFSTSSKRSMNRLPMTLSISKCVALLGGYIPAAMAPFDDELEMDMDEDILLTPAINSNSRYYCNPRIQVLPTSYTDLYAELSIVYPDSEQTALCLVCGEILNAGGKGECTKHALKCGAGCGIFFLLQECLALIMHGGKAAYVHSPYVDAHGETPQYRGRPLNLDRERYDVLAELWNGHLIRERVIAERSTSRQVIIANFY